MGSSVPQLFIPELIELYKQGLFPYDKLITIYAFDEINQAAEDSKKRQYNQTGLACFRPKLAKSRWNTFGDILENI